MRIQGISLTAMDSKPEKPAPAGSLQETLESILPGIKLSDWLTSDGELDYSKLSIERNIRDAMSDDLAASWQACRVLGSVGANGRTDAVVFLLGLLSYFRNDLKRLEPVAEALGLCPSPRVADALFGEIHRLKSSNQTRTYLSVVAKNLSRFPKELVADRFEAMADDTTNSPRMREKYRRFAERFNPHLRACSLDDW